MSDSWAGRTNLSLREVRSNSKQVETLELERSKIELEIRRMDCFGENELTVRLLKATTS
jgi:urease accessory protein UreE